MERAFTYMENQLNKLQAGLSALSAPPVQLASIASLSFAPVASMAIYPIQYLTLPMQSFMALVGPAHVATSAPAFSLPTPLEYNVLSASD